MNEKEIIEIKSRLSKAACGCGLNCSTGTIEIAKALEYIIALLEEAASAAIHPPEATQ
jgi:hypothetical protein